MSVLHLQYRYIQKQYTSQYYRCCPTADSIETVLHNLGKRAVNSGLCQWMIFKEKAKKEVMPRPTWSLRILIDFK